MARGGAAASTADWWPAESPGEGSGEGIEDRGDDATPVDDHDTAEPDPHAGQHPPADPGASPPDLASGAVGTDADSGTISHAAGAEGAQWALMPRPLAQPRSQRVSPDTWTRSLGSCPATDHRDLSCPPIAQGTRRQSVVRGPVALRTVSAARGLPPPPPASAQGPTPTGGAVWRRPPFTARRCLCRRGCFGSGSAWPRGRPGRGD